MAHPDTGYSRRCALQAKTPRILHTPEHFAPLRSNPGLYPLRRESRYPLKKEKA